MNNTAQKKFEESQSPNFIDLRLLPGQVLQLEFDSVWLKRERSLLIGYSSGRSIIVTTPIVNGVSISVSLESGVNVRLFSSQLNGACAFRSSVIYTTTRPYPHLHLSMPDHMELGEIRKSMRAPVALTAAVHYGTKQSASSTIYDLSTDGARIGSTQLHVSEGDKLVVNLQCEVAGLERLLSLPGVVRTISDGKNEKFYGVQFLDVDDNDRITLHAFVLTSMLKPPVATGDPSKT